MTALHKLSQQLPLYKGNIPKGSAVLVVHTIFTQMHAKDNIPTLTFGLQWIVVLVLAQGGHAI
jgi:hypothetical protein